MPSLSSGLKLGTGSVSSLIKSANSLSTQLADYQDSIQAYNYEFSNKTDADYAAYQKYLQGRISTLQSTGSLTDASKALTLQKTMMTAQNSNITASIQYENIQVMAGNATDQNKLTLIQQEFTKAVSIGDMSTAQTLESQAYSLSQTIQVKAQAAASASSTLASAGASQTNNVATQLQDKLKQLNADTSAGGMAKLNSTLKNWVTANKATFQALANATTDPTTKANIEKAINTSQPNYFDIASGVGSALISAHYQAYLAELPYDPETAQSYLDAANDVANGSSKIDTLMGSLSLTDIMTAQANPAMYVAHENANTGQLKFSYNGSGKAPGTSAINGYTFDGNGGVIAHFTGQSAGVQLTAPQVKDVTNTLSKLGFSFDKSAITTGASNDNGFAIQASNTPKWLAPILAGQQNVQLQAYDTKQGIVTATLGADGKANIYLIAEDANGNHAVYKATGAYKDGNPIFGAQNAHGDYGFNQQNNSLWKTPNVAANSKSNPANKAMISKAEAKIQGPAFSISNLENNLKSWLGIRQPVDTMINTAQAKVSQINQQKLQAQQAEAAKLSAQSQAKFGATSIPNPAAPKIPIAAPTPKPVGQPTVNPQPAPTTSTNTLQPAGQIHSNVQGVPLAGNGNLPGIKL